MPSAFGPPAFEAPAFGEGEIRSLTGLRGCAAVLVMLYHFSLNMPAGTVPLQGFLGRGYLWVDLFFVLSGFVMAHSQARAFEGGYRWRRHGTFLLTRLARIYPLYVLVILESACLLAWRSPHLDFGFFRTLLLDLALVQAWGLAPSLEGAAWSISTEWGAYLAFPLLLAAALSRHRVVGLATGAVAMLAILWIATSAGPFTTPDQSRSGPLDVYSPATAAPLLRCIAEFTLGLLAWRAARHFVQGGAARRWAAPGSLAVVALLAAAFSLTGADVAVVALFTVLLVTLAAGRGPVARVLGATLPHRLGLWSYSIYLLHDKFSHPAGLLRERLDGLVPMASVVATALMAAVVVALAALTFALVERPLRRLTLAAVRRLPADRSVSAPIPATIPAQVGGVGVLG